MQHWAVPNAAVILRCRACVLIHDWLLQWGGFDEALFLTVQRNVAQLETAGEVREYIGPAMATATDQGGNTLLHAAVSHNDGGMAAKIMDACQARPSQAAESCNCCRNHNPTLFAGSHRANGDASHPE